MIKQSKYCHRGCSGFDPVLIIGPVFQSATKIKFLVRCHNCLSLMESVYKFSNLLEHPGEYTGIMPSDWEIQRNNILSQLTIEQRKILG